MRRAITIAVSTAIAALTFIAGVSIGDWAPKCPTEDSCSIDYRNPDGPGPRGYWVIKAVTP
jgi:hypothetical protein